MKLHPLETNMQLPNDRLLIIYCIS